MKIHCFLLLLLNGSGWTSATEYTLGENCHVIEGDNMNCAQVEHIENCDEMGYIQTREYPLELNSQEDMGHYYFTLISCTASYITLEIQQDDYLFESPSSITVGEGETVEQNVLFPIIEEIGISMNYSSTTNKIWLHFFTTPRNQFFRLRMKYIITPELGENKTLDSTSGSIESPNFGQGLYPAGTYNYFIKYENAAYQDILLTIVAFDLDGQAGDYLRIGGGSDISEDKAAYLLSWKMNKGYSILINNIEAFITLKSNTIKSGNHQGFLINYKYIDKNITTLPPSTTTEPPGPACHPDSNTTVVFINIETSGEAKEAIAALLNCSAYESGYANDMLTPLSANSVKLSNIRKCSSNWNVDHSQCFQIDIAIDALSIQGDCVFTQKEIKAAVKSSCNTFEGIQIHLPEDFLNIYLISILVCSGVVLIFIIVLLCIWREKLRQYYKQQRKYYEIQTAKMEKENDARMASVASNAFDIHIQKGIDNPNFEMDEDQIGGGLDWECSPTTTTHSLSPTPATFNKRLSSLISTGSSIISDDHIVYQTSSRTRESSADSSSSGASHPVIPRGILKVNKPATSESLNRRVQIFKDDDDIIEFDKYMLENRASPPEQNQGRLFYDIGFGDQRDSIGETHL